MRVGPLFLALVASGCDDDAGGLPGIRLGEPTIVVVANPDVNDANIASVPAPGGPQGGIDIAVIDGPAATTDSWGVAVLAPVATGDLTLSFADAGVQGQLGVSVGSRDLIEIAVAVDESRAEAMAVIEYDFSGQVVDLRPETVGELEAALSASGSVIILQGGTYVGDLEMVGSDVTLIGEGPAGGHVTIEGDLFVGGSGNRVRGAVVTGAVTLEGSGAGLTFSRVLGPVNVTGSDARLLQNSFCGGIAASGSGLTALGNLGLAPLEADCP